MAKVKLETDRDVRGKRAGRRAKALFLAAVVLGAAALSSCASTGQPPVVPWVAKQADGKAGTWW